MLLPILRTMAIGLVVCSHTKRCDKIPCGVAMNQEQRITIELITPTTTRIPVSHHDESFWHDVVFLHVIPITHEVSAATALDLIFINFVNILGCELGIVIHFCIEAP